MLLVLPDVGQGLHGDQQGRWRGPCTAAMCAAAWRAQFTGKMCLPVFMWIFEVLIIFPDMCLQVQKQDPIPN